MHDHPSPTDYLYLAALAVGATATTCWYIHREVTQPQARRTSPAVPIRPTGGTSRRPPTSRSRGRLALANPAAAEATARRRLLEAHLRDQLAAEVETRVEEAAERAFELGYKAAMADGQQEPLT